MLISHSLHLCDYWQIDSFITGYSISTHILAYLSTIFFYLNLIHHGSHCNEKIAIYIFLDREYENNISIFNHIFGLWGYLFLLILLVTKKIRFEL